MKKAASQPPFCLRDLDILLADVAPGCRPGTVMWTQAARVLRAGAHSTLHGVVFAILCLGSAVYRPQRVEDARERAYEALRCVRRRRRTCHDGCCLRRGASAAASATASPSSRQRKISTASTG